MAVTINQQPPILTPAYGDIVITVSSNLVVTKFKFKYVFDIFSTNSIGSQTTYVGRVKQTPNPSGVGMLDLSRYLQNQVDAITISSSTGSVNLTDGSSGFANPSNCSYIVYCGEEYSETLYGPVTLYNGNGTTSTGTTLSSIATTTGYTFNGVKQFEEGFDWNETPYVAPTGRKLLTNSPRTLYKETDEYFTMASLYGTYSGTPFNFSGTTYAQVYNSAGTLLTTYNPSPLVTYSSPRIRMLYSAQNISNIVAGYENTWNKIVIGFSTDATERITIYRTNCPWDKYDPKDIIFLNRLGGFDTFRFYGSKDEEVKIERGTYQRAYGTWSSNTFNYNTSERGTSNIKTDLTVNGDVMSDFLDRDTVNWLEELLTSPQVYMIEDSKLIPINITNSTFKNQLRGNVRLRQVSFSYVKSNQTRTQQQ